MKINIFTPLFFIYIAILMLLTITFGFLFWNPNWIFSQLIIGSLIVLFTFVILHHLRSTEREVSKLLLSIKYQDFSSRIKLDKRSLLLYNELKDIHDLYEDREDGITNRNVLINEISENLPIGLIVYSDKGNVVFQNENSKKLLGISQLKEIYQLKGQIPKLYQQLTKVDSRNTLIHLQPGDYDYNFSAELSIHVHKKPILKEVYTILKISLSSESQNEPNFESWINFGKVISHEILNGMSPILSLTESINEKAEKLNEGEKAHIQSACTIINERCNSLIHFTEKYRNLVKIPSPDLKRNNLPEVIQETIAEMGNMLDSISIKVDIETSNDSAFIMCDENQIKQVFLNLFLNSIYALSEVENKEINIVIKENKSNFLVLFCDNGIGIPKDLFGQVFVPYFSTKDDGSGIGLALSRQILWKHNSTIQIKDIEKRCCFSILFPKVVFS